MKWALIGAVVVIAGLLFAMLTSGKEDKQQTQTAPPQVEVIAEKPTEWGQDYSATFRYGANIVTVASLKVTGLRKKQATLRYRILVRNATGRIDWISKPSSWTLRDPLIKRQPVARTISKDRTVTREVALTFQWPRKALIENGAALEMRIPGDDGIEKVMLAVEIPRNLQGVSERRGLGSFTR